MKSIGGTVYRDGNEFWVRPTTKGKRTWLKLKAQNVKDARREALEKSKREKAEVSMVCEMLQRFVNSGCPDSRLKSREFNDQIRHQLALKAPLLFFGEADPSELQVSDCLDYAKYRMGTVKRGTGERTVDMELQCLSNAYTWAVSAGLLRFNPIFRRPRFRQGKDVVHCREFAPKDIDEVHAMARELFKHPRSAVLGWQLLFEALTGARTSEVLALRFHALVDTPGYWNHQCMYIGRSKRGINPWIPMTPWLLELINQHENWASTTDGRFGSWWFMSSDLVNPVGRTALTKALLPVCMKLGIPKRTSHGLRSFYVTARRSQGASDAQIAGEIGDKTVQLISTTYGDRPPNWTQADGEVMTFTPKVPAWEYFNQQKQ